MSTSGFHRQPQLQQLQTDFYEAVGKRWGLQRGKEGSQKKHLSTAEFKAKKIKDNNSHYTNVGKELARTNPTEYRRIVHGKPKTINNFFDSVLALFTPDVVRQVPRLQQIEAEIEEERKKQEKLNNNDNYKN